MTNVPQKIEDASFSVIRQTEAGLLDVQVSTARAYPRIMSKVKERVKELATCDKETAEACFYAVPRAGKTIRGPGIRLAEIVLASYGNIRARAFVVEVGETTLTARGGCWDIESNSASEVDVKRRIVDKYGERYSEDMIATTANAAMSVALRNAVFKVVPMAIFKNELERIKVVARGEGKTIEQQRTECIEAFEKLGIKEADLLGYVGKRKMVDLDIEDMDDLRGIITALREGTIKFQTLLDAKAKEADRVAAPPPAGRTRMSKGASATAEKTEAELKRELDQQAASES